MITLYFLFRVPDPNASTSLCIVLPFLCQSRNDAVIGIVCCQSAKQQYIDFAVLVHRRIDSGIIGRTVNQRCFFPICLTGFFLD